MLLFPIEILPQPSYKIIEEVLLENQLIRTTKSKEIIDEVTGFIKDKAVCDPSLNMFDLSTSLFGVFKVEHSHIVLINKEYYNHYCDPNIEVETPIINQDYILDKEKGFFFLNIKDIEGQVVKYEFEGKPFEAVCRVFHTPMKWNYWHFSIRWFLLKESKYWHELEDNDRKKNWSKNKLSHSSRNLMKLNAFISTPITFIFSEKFYKH